MKPESLVIAGQPYGGEFVPGPCTHRPSHTVGAGYARSRYLNRKEGDAEGGASDWSEVVTRSEQVDRIPFFTSPCPSRVATWGRKKEREGWAFSRFWHSGPPRGGPARAISSVVERAPDNCVVVPGL
ncbi:ycf68 protein [Cinnamomum micranthum f. kanehirae]|uniref:Ycf68 protein n=1 Tax=Cinnamomum micranthum f. kanehirae TaxID=337451 RepID=A0A3S3NMR4_9MAGN|nr:ycf68 protein [Cinnamomum micranthum f. kanehirae]